MNKKVFLLLLIAIQCSLSVAQNYVYSVTTGTAWSRIVFPQQERQQRERMRQGEMIPDAPNFEQTFKQITYTYNKANTYNDSIFFNLSHQEWISMFTRRAKTFSQFYADDNKVIDQLFDYFKKDDVPDAAYDSLFFWTRNMYHRNINDIFLYEKLIDILLPHYEAKQDVEHLIFCYICAGLYNYQCARMGDMEASRRSEVYYQKILDLRQRFPYFQDPLNRFYFIAAYVNLAILHTQAGNLSLSESLDLTRDIQKLFKKPESEDIFRQDSLLTAFATWSFDLFSLRGISTYISHGLNDPWLKEQLYQSYAGFKKKINNDFNSLNNRYYAKLPYEDQLIEAYMGHISWNKAFDEVSKLFYSDPDFKVDPTQTPSLKINYLNNVFETSLAILNHTNKSDQEKRRVVKIMLSGMLNIIQHYEHGRYPFEKGMILATVARNNGVLKYLNNNERRDLIFRLIVLEQPTTYVHSTMVGTLAKELTSAMIDEKPEFFLSLPGITSANDVKQQKDSLINFVYQAAIYHDLGKITMPTVVNNCIRRIFDHEYKILELHPEKSRPFFTIDPSLMVYQDIAVGHHKWYNDKGYPKSFKNQGSSYFPIISLVTICDNLDAATENIGRNYHKPKAFETVLDEFIKESGTRYNPQIIDVIKGNKTLQEKMKQIVNDGRYDHYYNMYTGYFKQ